jgi:hypothetical protein
MSVNLDEKDLAKVESQKSDALKDVDKTYNGMVDDYTAKTDQLINESKNWVDTQTKLQEDRYGLEIEEIENQKADAKKDYLKEQSGAYKDWQKQSNKYGAEAERQASMGMANSGYSESSQVSMYNNYQNRVVAAREAFIRADTAYNLAMDKAKLQNDTLLAEIAYKGLQEQLTLAIESMQYKNSLLIQKASEKRAVDSEYHNRWMSMYSQIKQQEQFEATKAEQKRQFDANMAFQREQFEWQKAQAEKKTYSSVKGGSSKKNGGTIYSESIGPNKATSSKSTSKDDDEYIVDTSSLIKLGYAGKPAAYIDSLVKRGVLQEIVNPKTKTISYAQVNPTVVAKSKYNNEILETYLHNSNPYSIMQKPVK